jgi:hypothetical protein
MRARQRPEYSAVRFFNILRISMIHKTAANLERRRQVRATIARSEATADSTPLRLLFGDGHGPDSQPPS